MAIVRGQKDDAPTGLRIPTPAELGIGGSAVASKSESLDWSMVERRLDAAGATGYQMEKTSDGFRFTAKVAAGPVAGRGATRGDAVRDALAKLMR